MAIRLIVLRRLFVTFVLFVTGLPARAGADTPVFPPSIPGFADYPAPAWHGRAARADLRAGLAREFRSDAREALTGAPNFAGHWSVMGQGCGTGCSRFALVDHASGQVVQPGALAILYAFGNTCRSAAPLQAVWSRPDSRLLVTFEGLPDQNRWQALVWDGRRLKSVTSVSEICPP